MKCYCYETETEFVFCVEDADKRLMSSLEAAWFKKDKDRYIKVYNKDMSHNGVTEADKEIIKSNFERLGQAMFDVATDWKNSLLFFARIFLENGIEWYIIGSTSEAVLGVDVTPHDIDIIVHTKDFFKVKDIFSKYIVEPFLDNKGTWLVRYFGRLCIGRGYVDIAADDKMNAKNKKYNKVTWIGYDLLIEPLQLRYKTEIERKRKDRIIAIEKFINQKDKF